MRNDQHKDTGSSQSKRGLVSGSRPHHRSTAFDGRPEDLDQFIDAVYDHLIPDDELLMALTYRGQLTPAFPDLYGAASVSTRSSSGSRRPTVSVVQNASG